MQEPNEAKFAFKKLAYNNFKHYPLYIEWAPADVFDAAASTNATDTAMDNNIVQTDPSETTHPEPLEEEEEIPEENTTIFVKNVNFQTNDDYFRSHFAKIGRIYSATIATKKSPNGLLSMGYGFVQFFATKDAKEAIKMMQNSELDGHKLEIKLSNRTVNKPAETNSSVVRKKKNIKEQKQTGSKICVKNIPFEATENDIKKIFGYVSRSA